MAHDHRMNPVGDNHLSSKQYIAMPPSNHPLAGVKYETKEDGEPDYLATAEKYKVKGASSPYGAMSSQEDWA